MFNFSEYLKTIHQHNKLCKSHKFAFGTCTSTSNLEGALQQYRSASAFLIACDVCSGGTKQINGGWQQVRSFTFFVLKRFDYKKEKDRECQLDICRELRRQILSKLLYDYSHPGDPNINVEISTNQVSFDMDDVPSSEYPDMMVNNCCGLHVTVAVNEPINLCYNAAEWD